MIRKDKPKGLFKTGAFKKPIITVWNLLLIEQQLSLGIEVIYLIRRVLLKAPFWAKENHFCVSND